MSALGGIYPMLLKTQPDGTFDLDELKAKIPI